MHISFTKMHGLGNDFVIIDGVRQSVALAPERIRQLADRHFGIGFDQLLLVEPPPSIASDFSYRIFNADGNEVEQCGNGARCFARFVRDTGLSDKERLRVATLAGVIELQLESDGEVTVDMGAPRFAAADIPFAGVLSADPHPLQLGNGEQPVSILSMGNPHAVIQVDSVAIAPVAELGAEIDGLDSFPAGVNVGFMEIVAVDQIRLRVYERGVGETLACGTGACAAVVAGRRRGLLTAARIAVDLPGGRLMISWPGDGETVTMTGPAVQVFQGQIVL